MSIEKKYSYAYEVLDAFDVDKGYLENEDFNHFRKQNAKKLSALYAISLQRGKSILPLMEGLLLDEEVSHLFIYLSMVESALIQDAISPKKAAGVWQFMPKTARYYKLEVNHENDERYDVRAATLAAITYLQRLKKEFGKWYLAAIAYNCGEGCLKKAIQKANSDALDVLLDTNEKFLPKETREYIEKILLLAMIGEEKGQDSFVTPTQELIEVKIDSHTSLLKLATILNMDKKELSKLNVDTHLNIRKNKHKKMKVIIPLEKIYLFYLKYKLKKHSINYDYLISHCVRLGETLESIAEKYASTVEEIKEVNHLSKNDLEVDCMLIIPVSQTFFNKIWGNQH